MVLCLCVCLNPLHPLILNLKTGAIIGGLKIKSPQSAPLDDDEKDCDAQSSWTGTLAEWMAKSENAKTVTTG